MNRLTCGRGPYRDDDLHDTDEIYALYADPGAWSTGLGRALMTDALARSRRPTVLWVLRENARARRFYERAGFAPDGAQKTLDFHGAFPIEIRYCYDG